MRRNYRNFRRTGNAINPSRTKAKKIQARNDYTHVVARDVVKTEIKRQIETKFWDGVLYDTALTPDGGAAISATGFNVYMHATYPIGPVSSPTTMVRGNDSNDYVGDRITPIYLRINIALEYVPSDDTSNVVSILLLQAKGAFTAIYSDAESQFTNYGTIIAPLGFLPPDYNDRYYVLKRKTVVLNPENITNRVMSLSVSGRALKKIHFNSNGGVEAGPIFMTVISDSVAVAHPSIRATWRMYYKDA